MFYVALRILLYNKTRFLVTLLGLVFAVGLIFTQMAIYLGLMENASIMIDHTPGDIWITSKNCRNFEFSQPFPEFIHNHVCATEGIESAEKLIIAWGVIKNKNGGSEQVEIIGYNPDAGIGAPWKMKAGNPGAVKNGDFIIIDESAMKRLGKIEVGDYREILGRRLQIVGISEGVRSFTTAPFVFAFYRTAQKVAGYIGFDQTVFIVANVSPGYSVSKVVKSLENKLSGVDVYSKAAFSRPTRGSLRIYGQEVAGLGEEKLPQIRKRYISFVFQGFNLFPALTAFENVMVVLKMKGIKGKGARRRAEELFAKVGLAERMHFLPRDLSDGQKQRVAVTRALAADSPLILADEPTGNLDYANGKTVMGILKELARERGKAVIIATHDNRIMEVFDRIVFMEDGRIKKESRSES